MSGQGQVVFIRGSSGNTADVNSAGQLTVTGAGGGTSDISGQTVVAEISGQTVVADISGQTVVADISGQTVVNEPRIPTSLITGTEIEVTGASGGTQLPSGEAVSVTIKMTQDQTGVMRVGGIDNQAPFSGKGLVLGPGDSYTVAIDNPAAIRVHASISGEKLSWIANQY